MSQLEHSPGPWREEYWRFEINQMVWCIADADGRTVVEGNPYGTEPLDGNGKLIAAAPIMYHILRAILDPNKAISAVGLMDAAIVLGELEGRSDAEA
jgi:hypothetical protein